MPDLADRANFERRVTRDVNRGFRELREKIAANNQKPREDEVSGAVERWLIPGLLAVFAAGLAFALADIRRQITAVARRQRRNAERAQAAWDTIADALNAPAEISRGAGPAGLGSGPVIDTPLGPVVLPRGTSQAAQDWVTRYAGRVSIGIGRRAANAFDALADAREGLISGLLDFSHAEVIGATETTEANSAAEALVQKRAEKRGFKLRMLWRAEADACKRCRARANRPVGDEPPPLHPACRCWTEIVLLEIPDL